MIVDYKAIGVRIKIARIRSGLSQDEVFKKTGISTTHISNIENGHTKLSLPAIINIANALDVTVDSFLCDSVLHSKAVFQEEAQVVLKDCSDFKVRVIVQIMKSAKEALRAEQQFRKNLETFAEEDE